MHKLRDLLPYNMHWERGDRYFVCRVIPITIIAMAVLLGSCFANLTHTRAQNRLLQRGIGHEHLSFVLDGVRERAMSSSQPDPIMLIHFPEINHQLKVSLPCGYQFTQHVHLVINGLKTSLTVSIEFFRYIY